MSKLTELRKKFTKHYVIVVNPKQLYDVLKFCVIDLELHIFQGINNRLHKVEQDLTNHTYEESTFPYELVFVNGGSTYVVIEQNSAHIFPEAMVKQTHYPSIHVEAFKRDEEDVLQIKPEDMQHEMTLLELEQLAYEHEMQIHVAIYPKNRVTKFIFEKTVRPPHIEAPRLFQYTFKLLHQEVEGSHGYLHNLAVRQAIQQFLNDIKNNNIKDENNLGSNIGMEKNTPSKEAQEKASTQIEETTKKEE